MKREYEPVPPPPCGERKNIIIIGAGVTGVLSAWELTRAGHKVTILEARKIGNGSSSRSAACIRQQFSTPSTVCGMRYCVRFYTMWSDIMGGSPSPIVQNGYLFLKDYSTDVEAVKATVAMQQQAGLAEVEWLSREQIDEKFSHMETTGLVGATWCPTDGFLLPHIIYNDSAEAAKKLGVTIMQDAEIASVVGNGGIVSSVITTDGRSFQGDVFINATNAWAPNVSAFFGGYNLPITARRRYLYFLEGLKKESIGLAPDDVQRLPMTITPRGCYCRPEAKSQLMMGWLHFTNPLVPDFDDQDRIESGFGHKELPSYGTAVRKELATYIPAIEDMGRIHAVTSGFYGDTPDHNPLIGYDPNLLNLIHVAGFSGHGLMHAPFSARIVAHLIAENRNLDVMELPLGLGTVNLAPYRIDREPAGGESMVI